MHPAALETLGSLLPVASEAFAAVQLHQTSRSCLAQHFGGLIVGQRTFRPFAAGAPMSAMLIFNALLKIDRRTGSLTTRL